MKSIFLVLLIYYSFCQIYELKKYGTLQTKLPNGLIYLNVEDFEVGDTIHIRFKTVNGKMNLKIYYQFYYIIPNSTFYPSKSMGASSHIVYQSEVLGRVTKTEKYYYEIKKKEDGKYLIIEYSDFKSIYEDTFWKLNILKLMGLLLQL